MDSNVPTKYKKEGREQSSSRGYGSQGGTKEPGTSAPNRDLRAAAKVSDVSRGRQKSPAQSDGGTAQRRTVGKKQPKKSEKLPGVEESRGVKVESEPTPDIPPHRAKAATKGSRKPSIRKETKISPRQTADKRKCKTPIKTPIKSEKFVDTDSSSSEAEENDSIPSLSQTPKYSQECIQTPVCIFSPMEEKELLSPLSDPDDRFPVRQVLMVKIDLNLLSRIPGRPYMELDQSKWDKDGTERDSKDTQKQLPEKTASKGKRKHKVCVLAFCWFLVSFQNPFSSLQ